MAQQSARILTATYRLQVHKEFTLAQAREIVPYLDALGISHVYSSPMLEARPGSTHGYDVADPTKVNPEIGTDDDRRALVAALHERDMGVVLDIVPNHMGTGAANPYWEDVLAHGRRSRYAAWFDIDWEARKGRVLLPVLGDERAALLERGELSLVRRDGRVRLKYGDNEFPLDPESTRGLPAGDLAGWAKGAEGRRRMAALLGRQHYELVHWKRAAREINYRRFFDINELIGLRTEDPSVFEQTHRLILEWVREGSVDALRIDHIDGLRDPMSYLRRLRDEVSARRGRAGNDYPIFVEKILSPGEQLRGEWPVAGTTGYEFLNDLEAIFLEPAGTAAIEAGYRSLVGLRDPALDFAEVAMRGKIRIIRTSLAADIKRLARLLARVAQRTAPRRPLTRLDLLRGISAMIAGLPVYRTYIDASPGPVLAEDASLVDRALARARQLRGAPSNALSLVASVLLQGASGGPSRAASAEERAERLEFILRFQQTSGPATAKGIEDTALYQYVPLVSRNEVGGEPDRALDDAPALLHEANAIRAARWPRALITTNTHDTKRSADVRARIDVLTEIPDAWLEAVGAWRKMNRGFRRTVDGVRAPDANTEYLLYQTLVGMWPLAGAGEATVPDAATLESLRERVEQYMLKAVREAKMRTSWTEPNEPFETALKGYIAAIVSADSEMPQLLSAFVARIARPGLWNALSRAIIHLTAPGTADLYQGDELWNFALVDPDNRRPVDYAQRARMLRDVAARFTGAGTEEKRAHLLSDLVAHAEDGRVKLHLTTRALCVRRSHPDVFTGSGYEAMRAAGARAPHVFAFVRRSAADAAITVATRLPLSLLRDSGARDSLRAPVGEEVWGDTTLPLPTDLAARTWRCALTGRIIRTPSSDRGASLRLAEVLRDLPVALLVADDAASMQRSAAVNRL